MLGLDGVFLTPRRAIGREVFGAVYDSNRKIILESLRDTPKSRTVARDPAFITTQEAESATIVEGESTYLGHYFSHYGHYLLETMPMFAYLMQKRATNGIFLPWARKSSPSLSLRRWPPGFLEALNIRHKQVHIHKAKTILRSSYQVQPRAAWINMGPSGRLYRDPYHLVIERLKLTATQQCTDSGFRKIFLDRSAKRVSQEINDAVKNYFESIGFTVVKPEEIAFLEQVNICANAELVAGFSGSQLHNSIFAGPNCSTIEIGDMRRPGHSTNNQLMCDAVSSSRSVFVPYSDDVSVLLDTISRTLEQPDLYGMNI